MLFYREMDENVLLQIASVAPTLRAAHDDELEYWQPDQPPPTVIASALAKAFSDNLHPMGTDVAAAVFSICETAIEQKGEGGTAVATGFLEALQHADGRQDFDFRQVAPYLGPLSRAHCIAMDKFHGASTRGLS